MDTVVINKDVVDAIYLMSIFIVIQIAIVSEMCTNRIIKKIDELKNKNNG